MVLLLKACAALFAVLPLGAALAVGRVLGWVYGHVLRYHRRDALTALQLGFPERKASEIRAIVESMYGHLGRNAAEFLRVLGGREDEVHRLVRVVGEEHVTAALGRGRGALALVSHLGNWEYLALVMARRFQPSGMIIKEMRQGRLNDYLIRRRRQQGIRVFPRRGAYRSCLRALRENALIGFVLDQNMMWKEGLFVDFFGRPACTTPGLAHLAAHAQAPVIPMFILRQENGCHVLTIHPALEPPASREPADILAATQCYTALIEEAVRRCPEQWIWIHRRWRTTPDKVAQAGRLKAAVS